MTPTRCILHRSAAHVGSDVPIRGAAALGGVRFYPAVRPEREEIAVTMTMRFGLLADYAAVGAAGKLTIVHTFDQFRGTPQPVGAVIAAGYIVARVEGSIADAGVYELTVLINDDDETPLESRMKLEGVELGVTGPGLPLCAQFVLPLAGLAMPPVGSYCFVFRMAEQEVGRIPFHVMEPHQAPKA